MPYDKKTLPNCNVTGIDLDSNHIEFARKMSEKLNLECDFYEGDATNLNFTDESFDVVFSYTVADFCEAERFIDEQYRILKHNGKCIILFTVSSDKKELWIPTEESLEKLWFEASKNENSNINRYNTTVKDFLKLMDKQGFIKTKISSLAVVQYSPNNDDFSSELSIKQINEQRLSEICSVKKARKMAPLALTDAQYNEIISLINIRWDKVIFDYQNNIKTWDYTVSTVIAASRVK